MTKPASRTEFLTVPRRQLGMIACWAARNANLLAFGLEPGTTGMGVVGGIGSHRLLVAADQVIDRHRALTLAGVVITVRIRPKPSSTWT
ncbi:hypothetical protein EOA31_38060 [Mesorhizobium sp. M4B.F.Ca.ET.049.02.1.2]|nr:hypothetical protein EOA31_38060 [Mesorhizobium sp. M4B.F.Ca.ET.049.02.1.2]